MTTVFFKKEKAKPQQRPPQWCTADDFNMQLPTTSQREFNMYFNILKKKKTDNNSMLYEKPSRKQIALQTLTGSHKAQQQGEVLTTKKEKRKNNDKD